MLSRVSNARANLGILKFAQCGLVLLAAVWTADKCPLHAAASSLGDTEFETAVKPLIKENCASCHNEKRHKGDLNLEQFLHSSATDALKQKDSWQEVIDKLEAGEMPPDDKPQPSEALVTSATNWLRQSIARIDQQTPVNPGRVTVRRLNRTEYNNTIRDLLGVNLRLANDFPPDASGYGFDNIGDVLSLSPVLTERYLKAAERAAEAAIPVGLTSKPITARYDSESMGQQFRSQVQTTYEAPFAALYDVRLGWEQGNFKGTKYNGSIYIDGKEAVKVSFPIETYQDRSLYARKVKLSQGPHLIAVRMELAPASEQSPGTKLAPPYPTLIEISGPFDPTPAVQTASYQRIFFKGPPKATGQAEYCRQIFARFLPRAYRRPVATHELYQVLKLAAEVRKRGGSFEQSVQVGLTATLMSPHFLFRIERDPSSGKGSETYRISDIELASRLSYFLWSSMPDDNLLTVAAQGKLHEPAVLEEQVRRMLADPKAVSLSTNFAAQWLQIRNLEFNTPDRGVFPDYDLELRDAMRTETELFFQAIVAEDRSVMDFVDGEFTFLNERLAKHYGIPGVVGSEFRRVDLKGTNRSGVLTQASVLTVSSYPTRTSPVIRGKWVLENILNAPPPPPPPNVPNLDDQGVGKTVSLRQQLEKHRASAECASCHARMDPLGFGLENFDAIGRWRSKEGDIELDVSGRLPNGKVFNGAKELKAILNADAPRFVRGLTEKMFTYALGRGVESYDRTAVESIAQRVQKNSNRFSELVLGIVESAPFEMRNRAPSETTTPSPVRLNPTQ